MIETTGIIELFMTTVFKWNFFYSFLLILTYFFCLMGISCLQTSLDGTQTEVRGATLSSYVLSVDDIGFFLSISCEPVRSDWARGPIVLSEQIGPIVPGMYFNFLLPFS